MSHACDEVSFANNIPGSYICLFRNQFKLNLTFLSQVFSPLTYSQVAHMTYHAQKGDKN